MRSIIMESSQPKHIPDEAPPFLGSWSRVYAAVLLYLGFLIVTLYAVSRLF
ncbi:MAG: hypothetical protein JO051_04345 [Acidobacteriaceae bacterium]|nr:hypothetical protein [Acidobacteriaceae bacterium]